VSKKLIKNSRLEKNFRKP